MTLRRIVVDAALKGQRSRTLHRALPPSLRRRVSGYARRQATAPVFADWSTPLLADAGRTSSVAQPDAGASARSALPCAVLTPGGPAVRCLLVTAGLDAGGMDEMVSFLARRLPAHGVHTAVLHTCTSPADEGSLGRIAVMLRHAGVEVAVLSEQAGRRWIRQWQPDVISAHGAPPWVLDEARVLSVPYVEVLHDSLFDLDWSAEAERGRDVSAFVAVSELVRQRYLRGATGFPAESVVTIPNAVDVDRRVHVERTAARAALGLADEFLFVSLARHCLQKNTFGLLAAFGEVAGRHPDAHLLVAGRPEDPLYCSHVIRLRDGMAARDRVHLRDNAPDSAVSLVLSAADAFVLDSFFEGGPIASMEALRAGLPVVVSDVGAAREQLGEAGRRGYVVTNPLGDPLAMTWQSMRAACYERQVNRDELVAAMCTIVDDRARWAAARDDLAAESADRFTPERCSRAHAELLQSLVAVPITTTPLAASTR
jgi:glycosyltransferase involved in cell wall biosynthesis